MVVKKIFKIHYIIFFFVLFLSKAIAEPTLVRSKSINADNGEFGLTFNNDGTKMYTTQNDQNGGGLTNTNVYEYVLTTAYDISTATLNNTKTIHIVATHGGGNALIPTQVVFNNDGTKMFIADHGDGDNIDYWSLTTAFDVSTASLDGRYDVSGQEVRLTSVAFNNDGTRMIIAGVGNNTQHHLNEYSLDTAFDLSSGTTHLNTEDLSSFHSYINGVTFNHDGTKMYTIDGATDDISQFKLTTPYDVSTYSLEGTFDVSSHDADAREVAFSHDGSKMFFIGNTNNKVFEFNLSCNWSIIDGACDDPADTSDEGKDITSLIESQTATAKQIAIHATTPVLNRMYWLRRHRTNDKLSNQNIKFNFSNSMMASLSKVIPVSNKTNDVLDKLSDDCLLYTSPSPRD